MKPEGTRRSCRRYRRTVVVTIEEDQRRDDPEHEHMLGHREVDAEDRREMNQWVIDRAVGDVLDDDFTGIELLARLLKPHRQQIRQRGRAETSRGP